MKQMILILLANLSCSYVYAQQPAAATDSIPAAKITELKGITISTRKKMIEQKVDRTIFHVENAIMPAGGTAVDALKATPGVRVQQDNISIIGKGAVLVMIDDRLQRMTPEDLAIFLKSIPAENIKSIEVITTPPSKYEAEGNNGLLNIRLKKARANSWNASIGAAYIQKTYSGSDVQGVFNYNHNHLALQASFNKGQQQLLTNSTSQVFYPKELWEQVVKNKSTDNTSSASFGLDYQLTPTWATGIRYLGSFTDRNSTNQPLTTRYGSSNVNGYINSDVAAGNKPVMHAINWHQVFTQDSGKKTFSTDLDFFSYDKRDNRSYSGNELDPYKGIIPGSFFAANNNNINKMHNIAFKADADIPYKWANISFGGRFSLTNTNNDLTVFDLHSGSPVLNSEQSNMFNYKEYNEALYFSASKKISSKWETQAGWRIEATQTSGYSQNLNQTNTNRYLQFFPTAYITYTPNTENTFSLNYSRRIRRPDFDYLNPFIVRSSPYFYAAGNPFLQPSYINNLEFSYMLHQHWTVNVYHSAVSNFSQDLSITDSSTNITRQTPLNYANTSQTGISSYYNFSQWSWWTSYTGFNVNYQRVRSRVSNVSSIDGYNGYIYTNNDFTLNKSKSCFLSLNYALQLPGRYQIFQISTLNILDVSVKFLLAKKKLAITLTGEDLLNAQKPLIAYYSNGIKNTVQSYGDTRGFRIGLTYKLGNKLINVKQRNFGNEEERNRAN
ncbi:outer membrane beta-barrel family protein [Chitinophaga sp. Cy-1792]|uniref:outer membrane beta-barrel family protein n=1 Tax=Chitinophaga sp. Cy-1792 TaxID=2608339 RepID=UPI0014242B21|nr:outer membrane beta-barrel family protein [Chitinophaga sp. Cy-1792]NIG55755.1 TonB-dependent receptor [Chitinophaga sp. Cy-1792]